MSLTSDDIEDVRLAVYGALASTGQAPDAADLAAATGLDVPGVHEALLKLHDSRDVVLRDGKIVMAHPFATVPLGFSVMGPETLWWGGCAWDSFAIPQLLPWVPSVLVATQCPACAAPHAWSVNAEAPPEGPQVAHFLTPTSRIWDDVVHSCANQRIFCSSGCVSRWLVVNEVERGYEMDLATLWRLARSWYSGRLDRGYQRREAIAAADYFSSVGLRGTFWGLVQNS